MYDRGPKFVLFFAFGLNLAAQTLHAQESSFFQPTVSARFGFLNSTFESHPTSYLVRADPVGSDWLSDWQSAKGYSIGLRFDHPVGVVFAEATNLQVPNRGWTADMYSAGNTTPLYLIGEKRVSFPQERKIETLGFGLNLMRTSHAASRFSLNVSLGLRGESLTHKTNCEGYYGTPRQGLRIMSYTSGSARAFVPGFIYGFDWIVRASKRVEARGVLFRTALSGNWNHEARQSIGDPEASFSYAKESGKLAIKGTHFEIIVLFKITDMLRIYAMMGGENARFTFSDVDSGYTSTMPPPDFYPAGRYLFLRTGGIEADRQQFMSLGAELGWEL